MTTAAIVVSASAGAQSPAVFSMGETSGDSSATGSWGVSPGGGQVNVHWLCPAFENQAATDRHANLAVALQGLSNTGNVSSSVLQANGSTDVDNGQPTTNVVATAGGTGVASFQIELRLDDRLPPAGPYQTTIQVTLTSP